MKFNKHLLFIFIIILIAFVIAIAVKYHQAFQNLWLWFVGFIGVIAGIFRQMGSKISSFFATEPNNLNSGLSQVVNEEPVKPQVKVSDLPVPANLPIEVQKDVSTTIINVLRYSDDGETTLGLLYINDKFYCYTLEDTYSEIKVHGKTRIPAGSYKLDFIKQLTPLTLTYRQTRDWFDFHLEIKNVPGFTGVYIHNGGTSADTEGCLLIADGITSNDSMKTLTNSRKTFEEFYKLIGNQLRNNYDVNINIYDDNWINHLKN